MSNNDCRDATFLDVRVSLTAGRQRATTRCCRRAAADGTARLDRGIGADVSAKHAFELLRFRTIAELRGAATRCCRRGCCGRWRRAPPRGGRCGSCAPSWRTSWPTSPATCRRASDSFVRIGSTHRCVGDSNPIKHSWPISPATCRHVRLHHETAVSFETPLCDLSTRATGPNQSLLTLPVSKPEQTELPVMLAVLAELFTSWQSELLPIVPAG